MTLNIYHDIYQCQGKQCQGQLVMIHGWGMNSLVWDDLIPVFIQDYEICVVDLPGFGRSPIPNTAYDLDFLVKQILSVVPERAIWFAWSLGGLIAQQVAIKYPERIEQGFLIGSSPKFVANDSWPEAMHENIFKKFQSMLEEDWEGTLVRFLTLQCKGSETIKEDTRKLREYLFHYGLPANKALREGLNILIDSDLRQGLEALTVPLHFIFGEFDVIVPRTVSKRIGHLSSLISTHQVSGASHAAHISHPHSIRTIFIDVQDFDDCNEDTGASVDKGIAAS